ncbi:uncharacterized protein LOC111240951 [Vigna radiata var. radiata]|uniref:Uncharacterized protein LOC111240951 n=1 Tax=Vigna radiata var. radiata TaxID=3916 RepID=A0A3Q0ELN4_VIGRR|nr:uncharacterized protein LOC111240951 [Vigna radiata var. radiata]
MEQHELFARLMACKKKLAKATEGTSSPIPSTGSSAIVPPSSMNPTLTLTDTKETGTKVRPADPEVPKNKTKRKTQEKSHSPPKRRKTSTPLLTGPLDRNVHVVDRLQFNLNAEEKKPFKGMTPSESLNMAYELIARASVCLNYTARMNKPMLVTELETTMKSLEETKKENTALALRIDELTKAAKNDRVKADNKLKESRKETVALKLSVDTLKLELQKATTKQEKLIKEKNVALTERDGLATEKATLEDQVCQERELGFNQGIAQCHYFFKTPLEHPNFDIMKVCLDGKLVDLADQIATTPEGVVVIPTAPQDILTKTSTDLSFNVKE